MDTEVTFKIVKPLGVLSRNREGWSKEVNLVSWNGGPVKVDIRDWDVNHERMSRGITLYEEEARELCEHLDRHFYGG